ncbi:MAG: hypothetical protein Q7K44_01845 [Candidatus Liptonbacteria bacterium]|nr:hypothetical protein [Candidatus Liptonbacteria bacterium]
MEELELTYLAKKLPSGLKNVRSKDMLDIYIPSSGKHPTLRIRKIGERSEITKKQPLKEGDASRQLETTIPLTKEEYAELSRPAGKRVEKTRYYYEELGVNYEIDIFRGGLKGLVLVDVEFDSLEKKATFVAPSWCLVEVTQEEFIAGGMLCGKSYADIESNLRKLGYNKLPA